MHYTKFQKISSQISQLLLALSLSFNAYADNAPNVTPTLSDKQVQQLKAQLNQKIKNKQLSILVSEAKPTIEQVLGMTACFAPRTSFGLYQSDQEGPGAITDPWLFPNHDKSQCMNVQRILDWKLIAKNAFAFHVMYVSEQSGENLKKGYEIQKHLDGSWLFKRTHY